MTCEYCTEVTGGPVVNPPDAVAAGEPSGRQALRLFDEMRKRGVVARLRQRYGEARGASMSDEADLEHSAHLEWILGAQRNLLRDEAAFDPRVSELVVLWLQDFAKRLDDREGAPPAEDSRREAARDLRAATTDFADAFLVPRLSAVGQP